MNTRKIKSPVLDNNEPNVWACECGQMNLREEFYCRICGGDREENWEEGDREAILREEQWDMD